jgi:hypothetical protein
MYEVFRLQMIAAVDHVEQSYIRVDGHCASMLVAHCQPSTLQAYVRKALLQEPSSPCRTQQLAEAALFSKDTTLIFAPTQFIVLGLANTWSLVA